MSQSEEVKLFEKWSFADAEVTDPGLKRYISVKPVYVPHSMGRHEHSRFRKSGVSIVERLANNLMRPGLSAGKKTRVINLVRNAFEIIYLRTKKNPIQVLVRAIENSAPAEDTTRISYGGVAYRMAVDISPQRRVDLALRHLSEGTRKMASGSPQSLEECLAEEVILAANKDVKSHSIAKRHEMERVALSSR